jgi:nucleoid-associated protein YgaU
MEKVKIIAYTSVKFDKLLKSGNPDESTFVAMVNPDGYTRNFRIKYGDLQAPSSGGNDFKYNKTEPEEFSMELIFDKTGAIPGTVKASSQSERDAELKDGIWPELDKFKSLVFDRHETEDKTVRPPFLKVIWGSLVFKCVLLDMNIQFKMFRPDGVPIRAMVKTRFASVLDNSLREKIDSRENEGVQSVRTVKSGDTLPNLCKEVYGDPGQFMMVAKYNRIINIRNLTPGQKIIFPPLKK